MKSLAIAIQKNNGQVIYHLHMASSIILLGLKSSAGHLDAKQAFASEERIFL